MNLRTHRRDTVHHSVMGFMAALKLKRGVDALALTTRDGQLIAGVGEVDLERMAQVAIDQGTTSVTWENQELYPYEFELNDRTLVLTSAGAPVRDDAAIGGLCRILAA